MKREEEIENALNYYAPRYWTYKGTIMSDEELAISFEGFRKGAKWADEHPKSPWISVEDDLPCNHKELIETIGTITGVPALIATQNRVTLGIRIKSKDNKWYWCDNSTTLSPMIEEVMFWMPIPKPPKE